MSYVLQLWEQPAGRMWPRKVEAATAWVDRLQDQRPGQNPRFIELARRLTARYPCITSPQAREMDEDKLAWSDGPLDGITDEAVYGIGLNTDMLDEVRPFVLDTARALELSVADDQAGEYHYANGFVVTVKRNFFRHRLPDAAFDDPASPAYRLQPPSADLLPVDGMLDLICLRLAGFFARHGFVRVEDEPPEAPDASAAPAEVKPPPRFLERSFRRVQGAGWTELQISVNDRRPAHFSLMIDCAACCTEAALLRKAYFRHLGKDTDDTLHATEFTRQAFWMTDPQDLLGTDQGNYMVQSLADLTPVLAHFTRQAEARLLPTLRAFDSLAAVDALCNGGLEPDSIFFEGSYQFAESNLYVARAARNPDFDKLCALYIARTTKEAASGKRVFGDTAAQMRELVGWLKKV